MNLLFVERLGEEISELFSGGNIKEFHFALLRYIPDEVMTNFIMLYLGVLNKVFSDENGTCIGAANGRLGKIETIVQKLVLNP